MDKPFEKYDLPYIFVYGQKVKDFHTLNKDAIWTITTAALQEIDHQQQIEKENIEKIRREITFQSEKIVHLEKTLDTVLTALQKHNIQVES